MSRFAASFSFRPRALATPLATPLATLAALATLGALTTAALLAPAGVASAAEPSVGVLQATVYYSYQDLATDQGTRALYARITSAARAVCPGYDSEDLAAFADSRQCQRQAVARAIRQIGNGRLAAVYTHATGRHG